MIKATITDKQALLTLDPAKFSAYLKDTGWELTESQPVLPDVQQWRLIVPVEARQRFAKTFIVVADGYIWQNWTENKNYSDWTGRVSELIEKIALLHDCSQLDVFVAFGGDLGSFEYKP